MSVEPLTLRSTVVPGGLRLRLRQQYRLVKSEEAPRSQRCHVSTVAYWYRLGHRRPLSPRTAARRRRVWSSRYQLPDTAGRGLAGTVVLGFRYPDWIARGWADEPPPGA